MEANLDQTPNSKVSHATPVSCCVSSSKSPIAAFHKPLVGYVCCPEIPRLQYPLLRSASPKGLPSLTPLP